MKYPPWDCLFKNVCKLTFWLDKWKLYYLLVQLLFDKMTVNFNVFSAIMLFWVLIYLVEALLSQNKLIGLEHSIPRSCSTPLIYNSSHKPCAIPRNSASTLDRATTFCFLLLQVMIFPSTNMIYPEVDFMVDLSPA